MTAIFLIVIAGNAFAQNGRWVEYDLSSIGCYDDGTAVRGDGIVCFDAFSCPYFLIFDVSVGSWLTIELDETGNFVKYDTEGHIAFGYTDNLLLGYSDIGAVWDTIYFSGTLLDASDGYGLSKYLAYFITDQYLYIFDAEVGEWVYYDYGLPEDYGNTAAWAKDDYVGVALYRTSGEHPKNVVYSAHTKSFNQLEQGSYQIIPLMDHGFARIMTVDDDNFRFIGYSAYDNEFDVVIHNTEDGGNQTGYFSDGDRNADEFTVYMESFRDAVSNQYAEADFFAYSTTTGDWLHQYEYFEYDVQSYYANGHYGGQVASDFANDIGDYTTPHFFLFDGASGVIREPSVTLNTSDSWSFRGGGECFMSWDGSQAWAYNVASNIGSSIDLIEGTSSLVAGGQEYFTISRWNESPGIMRTYFYNGRTNNWQYVDVPEHHNIDGVVSADFYIHEAGPENVVVYYSSPLDEVFLEDMPDDGTVYSKLCGDLAYAAGQIESILFNGRKGSVQEFDFNVRSWSPLGIGTHSALFCNDDTKTLYGYSSSSDLITTYQYTEDRSYLNDTGYVGIFAADSYNKIYTYNALADSYIELEPVGLNNFILVGERTAIVSRYQYSSLPDYVYAFDPERETTGIDDDNTLADNILPEKYDLKQNYPNPFNPSTIIEYSLPVKSDVKINIYNLLGQKVTTLVDKSQSAGKYNVTWDGTDGAGMGVASGLYFYKINTNGYSEARKMLLLK